MRDLQRAGVRGIAREDHEDDTGTSWFELALKEWPELEGKTAEEIAYARIGYTPSGTTADAWGEDELTRRASTLLDVGLPIVMQVELRGRLDQYRSVTKVYGSDPDSEYVADAAENLRALVERFEGEAFE